MTPSERCIDLVKTSEHCVLTAYLDPVGVWTIGWGYTGPEVNQGLQWTQEQADKALLERINDAAHGVNRLVTVPLTQGQFDALVDFVYNLGSGRLASSTLLKKLNVGEYDQVPNELRKWVFAGHSELPGLEIRRESEIALWEETA